MVFGWGKVSVIFMFLYIRILVSNTISMFMSFDSNTTDVICRTWYSSFYETPLCTGAQVVQWVRSLDLTTHSNLSPIRRGFGPGFVNYKKGCTRLAAESDKVQLLLAHGRWFSPGIPASSTTETGRHDIAEILLKVVLKHQKSNPSCVFIPLIVGFVLPNFCRFVRWTIVIVLF